MTEPTAARSGLTAVLDALEEALQAARAMPMSSSVLVSRAELLDLVAQAREALPAQLGRADEVLATCETFVTLQARSKGLVLEMPPPQPSLVLRADREKVQQILLNLLSNAIKFTDAPGRVTVTHEATKNADGEPMVSIAVTDTGRGIPAEKLEVIFEPFVQVDVALTRTQDGVGLGLAISRELARAMDGDLEATSEVGRGTRLTLTLPRAPQPR